MVFAVVVAWFVVASVVALTLGRVVQGADAAEAGAPGEAATTAHTADAA